MGDSYFQSASTKKLINGKLMKVKQLVVNDNNDFFVAKICYE